MDQEEVFFIIDGTVAFEVKSAADEKSEFIEVGPMEAIRFGRGEYQRGRNGSDDRVVALALGVPKDSVEGRVPVTCPDCKESEYQETTIRQGQLMVQCPECEAIHNGNLH
jgi:mannose-6-phosphate isomerase-like protein (cupin superfamily)